MVLDKIDLGNETCLVVDKTPDYDEFCVYIEKDGGFWQDLVTVRKEKGKDYEVLVWDDEYDEFYTHKFNIKEYKDD